MILSNQASASLSCDAVAVVCMDWRLWASGQLFDQLRSAAGVEQFDLHALAGSSGNLMRDSSIEPSIHRHIRLCRDLHQGRYAILTNHYDCLAYGSDSRNKEKQIDDLRGASKIIASDFPEMESIKIYIDLWQDEGKWMTQCERVD